MTTTMSTPMKDYVANLITLLEKRPVRNQKDLTKIRNRATKLTEGMVGTPKHVDILNAMTDEEQAKWGHHFLLNPSRNNSGVAIIPVMTSPSDCPHGKCTYCPGGLNRDDPAKSTPQAYTLESPSVIKAMEFAYDTYRIIRRRLWTEKLQGHTTEKCEVIIQGGTFPGRSLEYQDYVAYSVYAALNDGPSEDGGTPEYSETEFRALDADTRNNLIQAAIKTNETSKHRCICFTVETKPDLCLEPHIDNMLRYGTTRIELGVQTLKDHVLRAVNRGHGLQEIKDAFRAIKTAGLKVCIHMMPGLPGNKPEDDIQDIQDLFTQPDYQPDFMKFYPTLVIRNQKTTLNKWFEEGKYTGYTNEEAADVLAHAMMHVPEWCRLNRYQRGFPSQAILSGPTAPNLRQLVENRMKELGLDNREIRAREAGKAIAQGGDFNPNAIELKQYRYQASDGQEIFLTMEDTDNDLLIGFVRLRIENNAWRPEHQTTNGPIALIRELRVYGLAQNLGLRDDLHLQHKGFGAQLMTAAEEIAAQEFNCEKIAVIAGVGVREYYNDKLGYQTEGAYVVKNLLE